jgi:hypothetical protein
MVERQSARLVQGLRQALMHPRLPIIGVDLDQMDPLGRQVVDVEVLADEPSRLG